MNFVLWVCRVMHLFGVIVWLGGLMFQNAIIAPLVEYEGEHVNTAARKFNRRFIPYIWMCVWTILITGVIMMLLSPQFVWFQYTDRWSILLLAKQVIFALMVFYAFGYARMFTYLEAPASNGGYDEKAHLYGHRIKQFRKISIFLGIIGLLLTAAML